LADLTGITSNNTVSYPLGIKAGVGVADKEGYNIKYVVADTGSSPAGVLSAAQKLVEQDHVFAILTYSAFAFSAAPFLASKGVPVIGSAVDSSEWITDKNMFSVVGTADYTKVWTQTGLFFKLIGVTNLASLGYSISPSSSASAKSAGVSSQAQGIKVGYLNANFPYGTNTGPVVLGMKGAGVNGFIGEVQTNTAIAIVQGARQEGLNLKGALMATGYGGDLVQGGPGAQQAAQGVYFSTSQEPVEMHTAATQQFQSALSTYAGVSSAPTFAEYQGYLAVDALVQGLKAAGSSPTQASFITAMQGITNFNGAGLYGTHSVSFAVAGRGDTSGADNCFWVTK
jgi:ABC-type branched-subunit amino acid transport system substrate-binding protein